MIFIVFILSTLMCAFTIQGMEKSEFESYKYGKRLEKRRIGFEAIFEEVNFLMQSNVPFVDIIITLVPDVDIIFEAKHVYELLYRVIEKYRLFYQLKFNRLKSGKYNSYGPNKDNILYMPGPRQESEDMYEKLSFLMKSNATLQEIMHRLIKGTVNLKRYAKILVDEVLYRREIYLNMESDKIKPNRPKPRNYQPQKLLEHQKQKLSKRPRIFNLIETGASLKEIKKELRRDLGGLHREYEHSTALIKAVKAGREDLVKLFISRGAKIDQSAGGDRDTALKRAIGRGNCDMIALLIKLGANCNKPSNSSHQGPLGVALNGYFYSCEYENNESIDNRRNSLKLLIQNNATIQWPAYSLPKEIESNSVIKEILTELGREDDLSKISIQ